jgi:hypothetical protein
VAVLDLLLMRRVSVVLVLEELGSDFLSTRSSPTGSCGIAFTVSVKSNNGPQWHDDLVIALALAVWWRWNATMPGRGDGTDSGYVIPNARQRRQSRLFKGRP